MAQPMVPKTAKEALSQGRKRYFTGKPCHRGHVVERIASTRNCVTCRGVILRRSARKQAPYRKSMASLRRSNHRHSWGFAAHFWQENAEYYRVAAIISVLTGVDLHIDHEIPLNHPLVCGLHYPGNLQLLPADANLKKSNRFIPYETKPEPVYWLPVAP